MHVPNSAALGSHSLHRNTFSTQSQSGTARAGESVSPGPTRDHLSSLPTEFLAKLAAHLPIADQIRLQSVNKSLNRDLAYRPGLAHANDPLAAEALQRGGYWVQVARLARGELSPATTVTINNLRTSQTPWPELMSFIEKFPRAGQARALTQLAGTAVEPAERSAIRAHAAVTDEALAALAAQPLDEHEAEALRNHTAAGPQTLIAIGTRSDPLEVKLTRENLLACLNHERANDDSLAALYDDAVEYGLEAQLHEHPKFGDATNAKRSKEALDNDLDVNGEDGWTDTSAIINALTAPHAGDATLATVADAMDEHCVGSEIQLSIANNGNAGPKTLSRLVERSLSTPILGDTMRASVAMNKSATDATLAILVPHADTALQQHIILAHTQVGDATLAQFANQSFDREKCLEYRNDPRAGDATLAEYAKWGVDAPARAALFSHPQVGAKTLAQLAVGSRDAAERAALRMHPKTDGAVLEALAAGTTTATERLALRQHPEATDKTLAQLVRFAETRAELTEFLAHVHCGDFTLAAALVHCARHLRSNALFCEIMAHRKLGDATLALCTTLLDPSNMNRRHWVQMHPGAGEKTIATLLRTSTNFHERIKLCTVSRSLRDDLSWAALYAVAVPKQTKLINTLIDQEKVADPALAARCAEVVIEWNTVRNLVHRIPSDCDATLSEIARHTVDPVDRKLLLDAPGSRDATLAALAATSSDPKEIFALRYHRQAGDKTLRHFAASTAAATDQAERAALRQHLNVGDATLAELALKASDPTEIAALREHRKAGELTFAALALRAQRDLAATG